MRSVVASVLLSFSVLFGCATSERPGDGAPRDARASGEEQPRDASPENDVAGGAWRPESPPAPMAPWAFRIALYNADETVGAYLEVDEASHFYDYVARGPRPTEFRVRFDDDYALRNLDDGRVYFQLRPSDGALVETVDTGYVEQDLHCHLTMRAELRCHHDDGDGGTDYVLSVRGDRIVGRVVGSSHDDEDVQEMNQIEPAPENDEQRRRVLFIWASYLIPADTGSHDGDACCMDGY
jgi:hypothetical protein